MTSRAKAGRDVGPGLPPLQVLVSLRPGYLPLVYQRLKMTFHSLGSHLGMGLDEGIFKGCLVYGNAGLPFDPVQESLMPSFRLAVIFTVGGQGYSTYAPE
jgi:hypothetical protein